MQTPEQTSGWESSKQEIIGAHNTTAIPYCKILFIDLFLFIDYKYNTIQARNKATRGII